MRAAFGGTSADAMPPIELQIISRRIAEVPSKTVLTVVGPPVMTEAGR